MLIDPGEGDEGTFYFSRELKFSKQVSTDKKAKSSLEAVLTLATRNEEEEEVLK